jgi:hypothetical protein
MPGLSHAPLPYGDPRDREADVLVMPLEFAQRYRATPPVSQVVLTSMSGTDRAARPDTPRARVAPRAEANHFFGALFEDRLPGYRQVMLAAPAFPAALTKLGLRAEEIHGSTGKQIAVFTRE